MEGAFTEIGPLVLYMIKNNGLMNKGQLSDNPYAWNEKAHLIFVDQPRHVGFSTVNEPTSGKCSSSKEAAVDIVAFYQEWLKEFESVYTNLKVWLCFLFLPLAMFRS